jgi:hypothetical protein
MPHRIWIATVFIAGFAFSEAAAAEVGAVTPGGPGVLTKCRDWLVTRSCNTYHHISLPPRIAVGDTIPLEFGSNPKEYAFSVARIVLKNNHCAIFSEVTGNRHQRTRSTSPRATGQGRDAEGAPRSSQMIPSVRSASTSAASMPSQPPRTSALCCPNSGDGLTRGGAPSKRTGQAGIL